jgi:hypothetical protein
MKKGKYTWACGITAIAVLASEAHGWNPLSLAPPSTKQMRESKYKEAVPVKHTAEPGAKSNLVEPGAPLPPPATVEAEPRGDFFTQLGPEPVSSHSFYAGAGLLFLSPYLSNNTAFTVVVPPTPPPPGAFPFASASAQTVSFQWGCGQAGQFWAGWTSPCGLGVRVGTFFYDHDSNITPYAVTPDPLAPTIVTVPPVIPPIAGVAGFAAPTGVLAAAGLGTDYLSFQSDLEIRTLDVVGTYGCGGCDYYVQVFGGGRWSTIKQGYRARLENSGDGLASETQSLDFQQHFRGGGPTIGVFARHGIWKGLGAYANVQGAILAGRLEQRAWFFQDVSDPAFAALIGSQRTQTSNYSRSDHVVSVAEIELGLEYGLTFGDSRFFVRGGVVGQNYSNAGNATNTLGTMSLVGGQVAAGFQY